MVEGYTYHLTHRCHNRGHFLKSERERDLYRKWFREGIQRFDVSVYAYAVTHNHVHVVAHADTLEAISGMMHLAAGSVAKYYNSVDEFRLVYEELIKAKIERDDMKREPCWTEALAVGSKEFIEEAERLYPQRRFLYPEEIDEGSDIWCVKEDSSS